MWRGWGIYFPMYMSGQGKGGPASGLPPVPAWTLAAPLPAECLANLGCLVVDRRFVNKYNFFVLEVVAAWIDPSRKSRRTIHHRGWGE